LPNKRFGCNIYSPQANGMLLGRHLCRVTQLQKDVLTNASLGQRSLQSSRTKVEYAPHVRCYINECSSLHRTIHCTKPQTVLTNAKPATNRRCGVPSLLQVHMLEWLPQGNTARSCALLSLTCMVTIVRDRSRMTNTLQ
jgi:hypothetical protein